MVRLRKPLVGKANIFQYIKGQNVAPYKTFFSTEKC